MFQNWPSRRCRSLALSPAPTNAESVFRPLAYTEAIRDRARVALAAHPDRALHKARERHEGLHRVADLQRVSDSSQDSSDAQSNDNVCNDVRIDVHDSRPSWRPAVCIGAQLEVPRTEGNRSEPRELRPILGHHETLRLRGSRPIHDKLQVSRRLNFPSVVPRGEGRRANVTLFQLEVSGFVLAAVGCVLFHTREIHVARLSDAIRAVGSVYAVFQTAHLVGAPSLLVFRW